MSAVLRLRDFKASDGSWIEQSWNKKEFCFYGFLRSLPVVLEANERCTTWLLELSQGNNLDIDLKFDCHYPQSTPSTIKWAKELMHMVFIEDLEIRCTKPYGNEKVKIEAVFTINSELERTILFFPLEKWEIKKYSKVRYYSS